jgi:anti-anti-sigma factor
MTAPLAVPSPWKAIGEVLPDLRTGGPLAGLLDALGKRGLQTDVASKPGVTVLQLRGRLDRQSAPLLKNAVREIVDRTTTSIDVDMSGVERVDGVGLAALVWAWGNASQGGRQLRLTHARPNVMELVAKLNLHQLLQIVDGRADD